jgi:hypothetical protein
MNPTGFPGDDDARDRAAGLVADGLEPADVAGRVPGLTAPDLLASLATDPAFVAAVNRARTERRDRLRAEVFKLATEAVAAVRSILESEATPAAVRLRAALAVLACADANQPAPIGPTSEAAARHEMFIGRLLRES